jgi:NADPH-dependent 7-cyano-7-deazaguanine reductase QueF-like protein
MILWENILLLLSEELNHLKYYLDSLLQNVHYFVDRKHMAVKRSALYYTGIGQF